MRSHVNVVEFLEELGVNNVQLRGDEAFYSCPFEGHSHGDTRPSASMNVDSTGFYCFGCGRRGNATSFLAELEGVSPIIARRMIRERFGASEDLDPASLKERISRAMRQQRFEPRAEVPTIGEWAIKTRLISWRTVSEYFHQGRQVPRELSYLLERGFPPRVLEDWEFGYDPVTGYVCFPYRDVAGALVGIKGRYPGEPPHDDTPKYKVLGDKVEESRRFGFPTMDVSRSVFGVHKVQHWDEPMSVVEGELNVVASRSYGINAVGISGRYLSDEQADTIMALTDDAVLVFDKTADALEAARKLGGIRTRVAPPHDRDPAEAGPRETRRLVRESISSASPSLR